ncbi:MAG: hypothetical protein Q8N39_06100 [Pelolinea sp.]|nr:hypothetical protein [Pelolinea sp.]
MKKVTIFFIILILFCACSSPSSARSDIISWAKEIVALEKQSEIVFQNIQPLIATIVERPPTANELIQLNDYSNNVTFLYNQLIKINGPEEVRGVQSKYMDNYAKMADSARYHVLAIRNNNIDYFNKSVSAAQDANRIGDDAYNDFIQLINKFSISCSDINYCE